MLTVEKSTLNWHKKGNKMKKFISVLAVLICMTAFTSCSIKPAELSDSDSKLQAEESKSNSENEAESEIQDDDKKENNKNSDSSDEENKGENSYDESSQEKSDGNNADDSKPEDENAADNNQENVQIDFEQIATEQYEKSCEMQWKYIINCPFELDYDDIVGNGYRVKDIDSLNDILWDYNTVFTSVITENGEVSTGDRSAETLQQKYFQTDNGLYCIDGGRGKNKSYKSTDFEFISYEDDILKLTAISYYEDSDGETTTKENPFTIVNDNGTWKTYDFTLPY